MIVRLPGARVQCGSRLGMGDRRLRQRTLGGVAVRAALAALQDAQQSVSLVYAARVTLAAMASAEDDLLVPLNELLGSWEIEAAHPAFPGTVVGGQSDFAWLEGERFLLQRSRSDHPDFPDSLIVFGEFEDGLGMHYFDSRGVHRVYGVSFSDGVWLMWRNAPGFSQRFTGTFNDDGDTIDGLWKLSRDDATWDDANPPSSAE